jgi:hypothetical protein
MASAAQHGISWLAANVFADKNNIAVKLILIDQTLPNALFNNSILIRDF